MRATAVRSSCSAALAIASFIAVPSFAQDATKHAVTATANTQINNSRVTAGESTWAPGTQNAIATRPARVIRTLVPGTLTVVYVDGRTEKRTFEPGGVYYFEPDTAANYLRNDSSSEVKVYFVFLK